LIGLQKQLRETLDRKARNSALGVALLARGRGALAEAARAWRSSDQQELARQAEEALAQWPELPLPALPLPPGTPMAEVEQALGGKAVGRVLPAKSPLRALDLLQLPLPAQDVDAVLVSFDAD